MPLPQVQAEIAHIQAHDTCTFKDAERVVFWEYVVECLEMSKPHHFITLKLEAAPFIPPSALKFFFYGP